MDALTPQHFEWIERFGPDSNVYLTRFGEGAYDEDAYLHYILPKSRAYLAEDGQALFIGQSGADGINFAFRAGMSGIWAYYPIDAEWHQVAQNLQQLYRDWPTGEIKV